MTACSCHASDPDEAIVARARAEERDALARKYGLGFLNLHRYCSCAQGGTYPGCPVHAEDWERWTRADERERVIREIADYMNEQWPDKPYSEGATYHSIRSILLEWITRVSKHITRGES